MNDTQKTENSCRICGSPAGFIRQFARRGEEQLGYYECPRCRCGQLLPQPSNEWLAEEYRDYFKKRASDTPQHKKQYFADLFRTLGHNPAPDCVLDLGPGEGDSIRAVNELFPQAQVIGIEAGWREGTPPDLKCESHACFLEEWFELDQRREFVDTVHLFDVLEHVRDPLEILRAISSRLKPGGMLLATFPNIESQSRTFLRGYWPQWKVEHLFYFSRGSIEHLAGLAGLETIKLVSWAKTYRLSHFLTIGSNFGPPASKQLSRCARSLIPGALQKRKVSLAFGEWLWIARRTAQETRAQVPSSSP